MLGFEEEAPKADESETEPVSEESEDFIDA